MQKNYMTKKDFEKIMKNKVKNKKENNKENNKANESYITGIKVLIKK
jgi:hypothetical protein